MKVKEFVSALDKVVPFSTADAWDNPGLSVGSPNCEVQNVACALDVTPYTIDKAVKMGANLLVTHHPIYKDAPLKITDAIESSSIEGNNAWYAITNNISIISLHTNLDKADIAQDYLAQLMDFKRVGRLEEPDGYGGIWDTGTIELQELANRCAKVFNTQPIVWGLSQQNQSVHSVAYSSGSTGDLGSLAICQGIDCLICGECGYHKLLELDEAGVKVIVLGHDASEKPFAQLLSNIVKSIAPNTLVEVIDEPRRWRVL